MKKAIVSASILATGLVFSGGAYALTTAGTLNVAANVVAECTVATTAVNFGNLIATQSSFANGDISVNCSPGVLYHIALDAGLNLDAFGFRNLKQVAGTATGQYVLSAVNTPFLSEWGDADFANTISRGASVADTGNGSIQPHPVYGISDIAAGLPLGAYSDTVNVTVNY